MKELVFFTSSRIKLAHARYLCREFDIRIVGFREKTFGAPYVEPRIYDREELIKLSYEDALRRWKKSFKKDRIFIIEDTSVAIEALSSKRETPGLDVKYWMAETNFQQLDTQLKLHGNNRRVAVRSDLVLHISTEFHQADTNSYKLFTSIMPGTVTTHEEQFETNVLYPWLDNKTFNKWFVPEGANKPVSMLSIDEADSHDFRAQAFKEMLNYLESQQIISRRSLTKEIQINFDFGPRLFIVCGPSCAGKTTLAEYLANNFNYCHIEASDFMYLSYYQRHGVLKDIDIGRFASEALNEEPEIVAQQILDYIHANKPIPIIITGFRSPTEVDWFINYYMGKFSIEVIYLTADAKLRFERSRERQREGGPNDENEFIYNDEQQAKMGLNLMEKRFGSNRIENNSTISDLFESFVSKHSFLNTLTKKDSALNFKKVVRPKLEELILEALRAKWDSREYFTTTEIAQLINVDSQARPKNKNNISRYFNQSFHPYYEIKILDGKRKYRLSNTGLGRLNMLKAK